MRPASTRVLEIIHPALCSETDPDGAPQQDDCRSERYPQSEQPAAASCPLSNASSESLQHLSPADYCTGKE